MYCMTCGSKMSSQAKFCTSCGSPAPHIPDTSDKTADSTTPSRNANAPELTPDQLTFTEAMDKQKHKSRRRIPTLLLIALVVLALSGIAYAAHTIYRYYVEEINPPITTVEEFTRALDEKDAEDAISCMDESTRNHYDAVFSLIDGVGNSLGLNLSDGASRSAFGQFAHDFFPGLSSLAGENIDYHISIATSSQSIDGNMAHVSGAWHVELISGDEVIEKDEPFAFNLVLERGAWRILYDETFREN